MCLLLLACTVVAMNAGPKVLVEVNAFDATNKLDFPEAHPYLRVYDNGRIEYSDKKANADVFVQRKAKLSSFELKSLIAFLARPEVLDLESGRYPSYPPNLNFLTSIDILIARDGDPQVVGTHNFKPPLGGVRGKKLPRASIELICRVESLRGGAIFRVTPEGYCRGGLQQLSGEAVV